MNFTTGTDTYQDSVAQRDTGHWAPDPSARADRSGIAARRERARAVLGVLARHGFDIAADRLPPRLSGTLRPRSPDARPLPVHLREALEELGPAFIKVGQVLSTRVDLLPPDYLAELSKLQDSGPTVEVEAIKAVVEAELGRPIGELFAEFDPAPLAAASIGQVHAARLSDGREVVVKVQKPGVREQVEIDLGILQELAGRFGARLPDAELLDPEGQVEEFGRSIRAELDYTREGRNTDLFRQVFADDPDIHVPEVHWSHTSRQVITQERLCGVKVDDDAGIDAAGVDRHDLALRCTRLIFEQVFELGVFHADPHPGNYFVLADGTLGVLDFGMVGRLDELTRDCLLDCLIGAIDGDEDAVIDGLERLGLAVRPAQRVRFRRAVAYLIDTYRDQPLAAISLTDVIDRVTVLLRRYRLRLPSQLALLLRAVTIAEGVGRRLDPGYVATTAVEPYLRRALARRMRPSVWGKRLARSTLTGARLGLDLPVRVDRLLGRLERGEQELGLRSESFEPVLTALNAMVNRLALSILVSGYIVGVAVLLQLLEPTGQTSEVVRAMLALGLLAVLGLGTKLAASLWRTR